MTTLEQLKTRKAQLEVRIAKAKARQTAGERRADTHLKAALGGAVLIALNNPQVPLTYKNYLLKLAEGGVQKNGLARTRFEALKAKNVRDSAPIPSSSHMAS